LRDLGINGKYNLGIQEFRDRGIKGLDRQNTFNS
jgi:coproporphyrinogen III oxidase-like Fe-S oxidoreductase